MKKIFILIFTFIYLNAGTLGTDINAVNKEINKLIPQAAPTSKNFKWSCETVSNVRFPVGFYQGNHITDKCIVNTDIDISFKVTCEYSILPTGGSTICRLGW